MKKQKNIIKKIANEIVDIQLSTISEQEQFIKIEQLIKGLSDEEIINIFLLVEEKMMGKNV